MLGDDPDNAFLLYALAKEYEYQQQTTEALDTFLDLKGKHPDYVGLYYHLGKLLESTGRPEDALAAYNEGVQVAKQLADHHALSELLNARANLETE
jgi:tetratricopeptide (TPR) repeat protein